MITLSESGGDMKHIFPTVRTFTSMINGYSHNNLPDKADEIFHRMVRYYKNGQLKEPPSKIHYMALQGAWKHYSKLELFDEKQKRLKELNAIIAEKFYSNDNSNTNYKNNNNQNQNRNHNQTNYRQKNENVNHQPNNNNNNSNNRSNSNVNAGKRR